MKQIINGKKYDTETAKLIDRYRSPYSTTDFQWYEEELYMKKTGEFFLSGEGGAMSKYAQSCGNNSMSSGEGIIALSIEEAKVWVENKLSSDRYEEIFGIVGE